MKNTAFNFKDGRFLKGIHKYLDSNPTDQELVALIATLENAKKTFTISYRSRLNAAIQIVEEEQFARLEVKKVEDSKKSPTKDN